MDAPPTYLYFDDIPEDILNESIFLPVKRPNYWNIEIQGLKLGDTDYTPKLISNQALIDTGTSLILVDEGKYENAVF